VTTDDETAAGTTARPAAERPVLRLLQLYPQEMNIYGDWGNTLTLARRAEWSGWPVDLLEVEVDGRYPSDVDLVVGGGGQDSGQIAIAPHLRAHGELLRDWVTQGVPMLLVCGSYQLFGHEFVPAASDTASSPLEGISVFDARTVGSDTRLIGNLTIRSDLFGDVIGYENHSGLTTLGPDTTPLGTVQPFGQEGSLAGGNNGSDATEGAVSHHAIGTYLHGSVLPKNPVLADWLLARAVEHRTGEDLFRAPTGGESLTADARRVAMSRPR
jgi:CobQ-like glutamine amidotransferase family enzyme